MGLFPETLTSHLLTSANNSPPLDIHQDLAFGFIKEESRDSGKGETVRRQGDECKGEGYDRVLSGEGEAVVRRSLFL